MTSRHSGPAIGQRVWNTQPEGGDSGLGSSPRISRGSRPRSTVGSGTGAASSSAFV
jgi:hypothetical protein